MERVGLIFFALMLLVSATPSFAQVTAPEQETRRMVLRHEGFRPYEWLESECDSCDIVFMLKHEELQTEKVREFVRALAESKQELMRLHPGEVTDAEYNFLAHMAIGILGRESRFFTSIRYRLKEFSPSAVRLIKVIQAYLDGEDGELSPNSRGPTQIKIVPPVIAEHYKFTEGELYVPRNAALATMGYLIKALRELKKRVVTNDLDHIHPGNYVDYLPYIYFGATRSLIRKTATPDRNIYVQDMKKYMTWVEIWERPANTVTGRP